MAMLFHSAPTVDDDAAWTFSAGNQHQQYQQAFLHHQRRLRPSTMDMNMDMDMHLDGLADDAAVDMNVGMGMRGGAAAAAAAMPRGGGPMAGSDQTRAEQKRWQRSPSQLQAHSQQHPHPQPLLPHSILRSQTLSSSDAWAQQRSSSSGSSSPSPASTPVDRRPLASASVSGSVAASASSASALHHHSTASTTSTTSSSSYSPPSRALRDALHLTPRDSSYSDPNALAPFAMDSMDTDAATSLSPPAPSSSLQQSASTSTPNSANAAHTSFRRQRASRACETCHARKVRCDAASLGVPCTNCTAFGIECRIPTPKRKKALSGKKDSESEQGQGANEVEQSPLAGDTPPPQAVAGADKTTLINSSDGIPSMRAADSFTASQSTHDETYAQFMKPRFARAPIKEAGRVAFLGESSNLSLLVHDRYGTTDVVHYPLPENIRGAKARVNDVDNMEIDILHQRGAFLLPPRALCDELVEAYFKWVAPVVPIVNRSRFMRQYRDPKNPPSLLLLQAILLAGSRVCTNAQLMDSSGSTAPAAMTFYKRAKALYDANYEDDRVAIVQAALLMGWYWEGPEDVTKNVFYWTRVAIVVAQGSGMHRSVEGSQLSRSDKRLWKRIWWTLFSRDRSVAVALGRPVAINPEDSDVEMITEEDFVEDEPDRPAEYTPEQVHVDFFINYVKLCEIMGLVLSQQYSVAAKFRRTDAIDLTHSDMALADWLQNCPQNVQWERSRHHFWSALLNANYYTTLCLLHRAHMPPAGSSPKANGYAEEAAYPSRTIAYHAAGMITSIMEKLIQHDEIRYTPAFIVYSLFSALIMHVYQMRSSNKSVVQATEQRLQVCMNALKEVSKAWLVAKMVHTLFESILGNKHLEERLQKAAGKRHNKNKHAAAIQQKPAPEATKRKFDDMDIGTSYGPPAPQVSYERSRPQTPAVTPSETNQQAAMPSMSAGSPQMPRQNHDAFMGPSRSGTRPTTPFNPSYSYPGTPPDLFLVTRNSPNISQEIWQNFQPDQLFPADPTFPQISPMQPGGNIVDPALTRTSQQLPMHPINNPQQQGPQQNMQGQQMHSGIHPAADPMHWQQQIDVGSHSWTGSNDETNSNSSRGGVVPTTLNVEDWFHFFGINGDVSGITNNF